MADVCFKYVTNIVKSSPNFSQTYCSIANSKCMDKSPHKRQSSVA